MLQTETHNSILALAMLRASAHRTQYRQEGTMAFTSRWPQLEQLIKLDRKLRHVDSTAQRALVQQRAKNWRLIGAMKSGIDSPAIG
ncbi:MAG: hypothetical protein ACK5PU_00725 [bacterium]